MYKHQDKDKHVCSVVWAIPACIGMCRGVVKNRMDKKKMNEMATGFVIKVV